MKTENRPKSINEACADDLPTNLMPVNNSYNIRIKCKLPDRTTVREELKKKKSINMTKETKLRKYIMVSCWLAEQQLILYIKNYPFKHHQSGEFRMIDIRKTNG
ncbi:hypothetical protein GQR58_001603 [Nymphon striatum]|nr:hypothetical protein GQR58_001603 [Nymphon striatum]